MLKILNRGTITGVFSREKGRGAIWDSTGSLAGEGVEGVTELEWMG